MNDDALDAPLTPPEQQLAAPRPVGPVPPEKAIGKVPVADADKAGLDAKSPTWRGRSPTCRSTARSSNVPSTR